MTTILAKKSSTSYCLLVSKLCYYSIARDDALVMQVIESMEQKELFRILQ